MLSRHIRPLLVGSALAGLSTAVLVVPAVTAGAAPADASAASATTTWTTTATKALPMTGATRLGPTAGTTPLHLAVALRQRNTQGLAARQGDALSPAQVTASYSPTAASAGAVASYLTAQGMRNVA